jgi:hypothetical protein
MGGSTGGNPIPFAVSASQQFGDTGSSEVWFYGIRYMQAETTGWRRYCHTFYIPNLVGKTVSSSGTTYEALVVRWDFCQGSNYGTLGVRTGDFYLAMPKLEVGMLPTPYNVGQYTTAKAECMPFYQKSYPTGVAPGTASYSTLYRSMNSVVAYGSVITNTDVDVGDMWWSGPATARVWDYSGTANSMTFDGSPAAVTIYKDGKVLRLVNNTGGNMVGTSTNTTMMFNVDVDMRHRTSP